jgi:lipopolysaccharide heptosyltransferase II
LDLSGKKSILIIRLSSLGDILLTTPLLRSIKKKYPDIKIDFILKEQYREILQFNPYISRIYEYSTEPGRKKALFKTLKGNKYDLVIDLQNNFRSAQLRRKARARSVKFNKRTLAKYLLVKFKYNLLRNAASIPQRYAQVLDNFQLDDEGLDFYLPHSTTSQLGDFNRYIGFAPGSRHFTKMWPKQYYADLGNLLMSKGYLIVLFGGKSDLQICYELSVAIPGSINLSNDDKIFNTAIDMKKCVAVVCNDSGLMHIACSLKIFVLSVFGSTVKEFGFIPYGNKGSIIENNGLYCRPCTHIGKESCPENHFRCMLELTPQSAFDKLTTILRAQ